MNESVISIGPRVEDSTSGRHVSHRALTFDCAYERLVAILHLPEAAGDTAVIVIVGGPQYRAGSHRQFVKLGHALATAGYPALRFDFRGMGDSSGDIRSFEEVNDDIAAAIDALQVHVPSVRQVVLWGLCDGASAALLYYDATHDVRVCGLCVLNPWIRSSTTLARTQLKHYYTRRLVAPQFWTRLFTGKVAPTAVAELLGKLRTIMGRAVSPTGQSSGATDESFQERMARAWKSMSCRVMLILSGNDYTAKEFIEHSSIDSNWNELLHNPGLCRHELPDADHTFSDSRSRATVEQLTIDWLRRRKFDMEAGA